MRLGAAAGLILAGAAALSMSASPAPAIRPSAPFVQRVRPPRVKGKNMPKERKVLRSTRGDKKRKRRAWANQREADRQRQVAEGMAVRAGVHRTYFYQQFGCLAAA
jgi:hypothetical protein